MSGIFQTKADLLAYLKNRRCQYCMNWQPTRWSPVRAVWGSCKQNSYLSKWTHGCDDFNSIRLARRHLRMVISNDRPEPGRADSENRIHLKVIVGRR